MHTLSAIVLGKLNHLSHLSLLDATKLDDFHRLIYRSHASNTLVYLKLCRIIPDSRASKLFARHCGLCKIRKMMLDVNYEDNLGNSAYFVSKILSTCINAKDLRFCNFNGCGVEPFALENRSRKFGQSKNLPPSSLVITTVENRASLKNLLAKVIKLPSTESVVFSISCIKMMNKLFQLGESQYWYHVLAQ